MTLACVATFSKGALLLGLPVGLALVLIGGAWRSRRRWPLWLFGGLAAAGVIGLLALFRTQRFADLLNFRTGTSFVRLKLWRGAWQMALDHPLLGVGPDNFLYAYRTRDVLPSAWEELGLSHPHNIVLDTWTRLGLLGVLAGAWALIAGWLRGWRLFKTGASDSVAHRPRPARRPGRDPGARVDRQLAVLAGPDGRVYDDVGDIPGTGVRNQGSGTAGRSGV